MKRTVCCLLTVLLIACHSSVISYPNDEGSGTDEYADGEYCAEVDYYNPGNRDVVYLHVNCFCRR
jgi:hypothetical protein